MSDPDYNPQEDMPEQKSEQVEEGPVEAAVFEEVIDSAQELFEYNAADYNTFYTGRIEIRREIDGLISAFGDMGITVEDNKYLVMKFKQAAKRIFRLLRAQRSYAT